MKAFNGHASVGCLPNFGRLGRVGSWRMNMQRVAFVIFCAGLAAGACAGTPSVPATPVPENAYAWKGGEVFRFEYEKSILLKQPDEDGKIEERNTQVSGVLILEVKTVSAAGAAAVLRIDSPRVTLPEYSLFSSQYDKPQAQPDRTRAVCRAVEAAIKEARWNVLLGANGLVFMESRSPANLRDWLKNMENAAGWRKRALDILPKLIEQDLGIRVPAHDRELLLYLGTAGVAAAGKGADGLRPRREKLAVAAQEEDKLTISFKRGMPPEPLPYTLEGLMANESVKISLTEVTASEGCAIFDTRIGMLDTLQEDYSATLAYAYNQLSLKQEVRVQYRLKRLAPPIVKP